MASTIAVPLFVLTGGTLVAGGAAIVLGDDTARNATKLALTVTLPAAAVTMAAVLKVWRLKPDAGPAVVMVGTALRMGVAVGSVAVLQDRAPEYGTTAEALGQWTTGFYLLTLILEMGILYILLSRPVDGKADDPATRDLGGPADEPSANRLRE